MASGTLNVFRPLTISEIFQKTSNRFYGIANTNGNRKFPIIPTHYGVTMKRFHGTILLIFLIVLTGCSKPNPAGFGGTPTRMPTPKEIDERHAANFLAGAKDFHNDGHPKYALNILKELLEQFPESEAAVEAKQMIAEIEKQQAAKEKSEPGKIVTVRGRLKQYPQDVKSTEAWLGNEFMVGETPIRPTKEVPREVLTTMLGENVEIKGPWNAGKTREPANPGDEGFHLQTPSDPAEVGMAAGSGIEASSLKKLRNEPTHGSEVE